MAARKNSRRRTDAFIDDEPTNQPTPTPTPAPASRRVSVRVVRPYLGSPPLGERVTVTHTPYVDRLIEAGFLTRD